MAALSQSALFCSLAAVCMFWAWSETEAAPVAEPKPFVANLEDLLRFKIDKQHSRDRTKRSNGDRSIQWAVHSDRRRYGDDSSDDQSDDSSDESSRSDSQSDESSEESPYDRGGRSPGDGQWYTDRSTYRYHYRGSPDSDHRFPSSHVFRYGGGSRDGGDSSAYRSGHYGGSSSGHGGRSRGHGGRSRGHGGRSHRHGGRSRGHGGMSRGHGGRSRGHGGRSHGHGGRSSGHGGRSRGRHSGERYGDDYGGRPGDRPYSHSYSTRYGERYGTRYDDRYGTRYGDRYGGSSNTPSHTQGDRGRRQQPDGTIIF